MRHSAVSFGAGALRLLVLLAGVGLLWLASQAFLALPGAGVAVPLIAVALPVFLFWQETAHLARRAVLAVHARADGAVRRLFWAGWLVSAGLLLAALAAGAAVLAVLPALSPWHWGVLAADAVLLALAGARLRRALAGELADGSAAPILRGWPLFLGNTVLLAVAFAAVDAVFGSADTRALAWHGVAEAAFEDGFAAAAAPAAGLLHGAASAVSALAWHLAQTGIPGLDGAGRALAWALFLLGAGSLAALLTAFLLGIDGAAERAASGARAAPFGPGRAGLALAVLAFGGGLVLAQAERRPAAEALGRIAAGLDPCTARGPAEAAALGTALEARHAAGRAAALAEGGVAVTAAVTAAHARAEAGIEPFLDWYFSLAGDYTRLFALLAGGMDEETAATFARYAFEESGASAVLSDGLAGAAAAAEARLRATAAAMETLRAERLAGAPCLTRAGAVAMLPALPADFGPVALPAGPVAGAAVGGAALMLARWPAQRAAALAAGRSVSARVAGSAGRRVAAAAGRSALKRGGAGLAAAGTATLGCAPGGAWAVACGLAAGAATWIAADYAVIRLQEHLFRDEMRAELEAELARWRAEALGKARRAQGAYAEALSAAYAPGTRFSPARDVLREG
ncbi:MAG: hypothetical protein AAF074_13720 [Pseudomonadota bacterium]